MKYTHTGDNYALLMLVIASKYANGNYKCAHSVRISVIQLQVKSPLYKL